MEKPKVIFFDAVGTLFGIQGSVGEIYSAIAKDFGVNVSAETVNEAFIQSFKTSEPPAFPGATPREIPEREFQWWEAISRATFEQAGVIEQFSDFLDFFDHLYAHFAKADPWYVYEDVFPTLQHWQNQGMELGIISNFDSRLHDVLKALKLQDFFNSITISSVVGAAKPNATIFNAALEKHDCEAQQAWHIGDSLEEDYQGAKAAGIRAFLLERTLKS